MFMENIIEVSGLTKKFKDFVAVDNISFSVGRGEIFAFLGPNGAGKTTTIRMMTTLLAPSAGKVIINGINKNSYSQIPPLFKEANKALLLLLLFLQLVSYFSDVWLSWVLINIEGTAVKLKDVMRVTILGVLGGQAAPIMGSAVITYIFYRKLKVPSAKIFFQITMWLSFVFLSYFLPFLFSLIFLPNLFFTFISRIAAVSGLIIFFTLVLFLYFLFREQGRKLIAILHFFTKIINAVKIKLKRLPIDFARIDNFVGNFYRCFPVLLRHKTKIVQASFGALVYYFGNVATLYFSFLVFGFKPNLAMVIFGYMIALILSMLTLVPETPGVIESSLVLVFLGLGFPAHIALFSSLLFRLFSFWLPLPLGIITYFTIRKNDII
jgi:uncharacterized protein (TIRG00374 family)